MFDGWKTGGHTEELSVTGGVRVIYSRLGDTADRVIKRMLDSGRGEKIVVTSDRDIASHAWSAGAVPVPAALFLKRLNAVQGHAGNPSDAPAEEDEAECGQHPRRGNPRQPSKKEKALVRALSKL